MKQFGVTAYPVLLNSFSKVTRTLPSYTQFNHVIVAVKTPTGYQYTDLTAELVPYGAIPASYQGQFGLIVFPDGTSQEITFPRTQIASNLDSTVIVGALDTTGNFSGTYLERAGGNFEPGMRSLFETQLDSTDRDHVVKAIARRYFEDGDGDSLVAFNGKDLQAVPQFRLRITKGRAATPAANMLILTIPAGDGTVTNHIADELDAAPPRQFPIDAAQVFGRFTGATNIQITLPAGWHAKLPPSVHVTGPFGTYTADYTQTGQLLQIVRHREGATGIYAPDRIKDLTAWLRQVGQDNAKYIVLEKQP
jgi:hypothetical protein